ncbi:MAG: dihydrodipicolinate synthase family protein [Betaproteobacteria bacterium]|nr:dihydrodipicolinate synthase family protein [Betaproteobacteria bacterium]
MAKQWNYKGIIPALALPLKADYSVDEADLRRLTSWLATFKGISALMTNGHTGDVFSLTLKERVEVTRIVADELKGKLPVISAVTAEGIHEAIEHALQQKAAGASGLDIMPPHHWLRFGMRPEHVVEYFAAIGEASGLDLAVHVYPSWSKASYSCEVLADLARLPWVKVFKVGTREMNKYARDIEAIRKADADVAVLTCHDEYLLASMVQGVDGGLLGFASFIPELILELVNAVNAGDLKRAMDCQARINPLKDIVYGMGEPTGDAHARMKYAMVLAGRLSSPVVRPPTHQPDEATCKKIADVLRAAGMLHKQAA